MLANTREKKEEITTPRVDYQMQSPKYFEPSNQCFGTGRLEQPSGSAAGFGISCAISGNGQVAAFGAPTYPQAFSSGQQPAYTPGAVLIYQRNEAVSSKDACASAIWSMTQLIVPGDMTTPLPIGPYTGAVSSFGAAVALDYSGDVLAVSGFNDNQTGNGNGAIWFHVRKDAYDEKSDKSCQAMLFHEVQKLCPILPGTVYGMTAGYYQGLAMDELGDTVLASVLNGGDGGFVVMKRNVMGSDMRCMATKSASQVTPTSSHWFQVLIQGQFYQPPPTALVGQGLAFASTLNISPDGEFAVAAFNSLNSETNALYGAYVLQLCPSLNVLQNASGQVVLSEESDVDLDPVFLNQTMPLQGPAPNLNQVLTATAISKYGQYVALYVEGLPDTGQESYVYVFGRDWHSGQFGLTQTIDLGIANQVSGDVIPGQTNRGAVVFDVKAKYLVIGVPEQVGSAINGSQPNAGQVLVYRRDPRNNQFYLCRASRTLMPA